jgi:high-affinity iron transporter
VIPAFVIFLREGVEASTIVAIVLSYLAQIGQRKHFRDIYIGVGAAVLMAFGGAFVVYALIKNYEGSFVQTVFEGCTYIVAAVILAYMTYWMRGHSRTMAIDLRKSVQNVLSGRTRFGLSLLAFQSVGREGLETAVFTLALIYSSSGLDVFGGAVLGFALSMVISIGVYQFGRHLNFRIFFNTVSLLLMLFGAGLITNAVQNFQSLGWLPVLYGHLWNTEALLSTKTATGDILHVLFGYSSSPTQLQLLAYIVYLAFALTIYRIAGKQREHDDHGGNPSEQAELLRDSHSAGA